MRLCGFWCRVRMDLRARASGHSDSGIAIEDGLVFLRFFGMQIRCRIRVLSSGCLVTLVLLISLTSPLLMQAQVAPAGTLPTQTPPVPQANQKAPPQAERAPGYSTTQKLTPQAPEAVTPEAATPNLRAWEGLEVSAVQFEGVDRSRLNSIPASLAVQPNKPLRAADVRASLRRLYAMGLYTGIAVEGERHGNEVTIRFAGTPQLFLGRVTVDGVKSDRLASQLQRSTRLTAGTRYDKAKMDRAANLLTQTLQASGHYQATFTNTLTQHSSTALVDVHYHIKLGKQTKVGKVDVAGTPGMGVE